jgi:8-oxo-dGTP pyrophosphatase MutT (NUDIX family)
MITQTSLSAGAVIVRRTQDSWEFLVMRSFKYWDFPKGMVETGEDPWEGALREVQEETGLKDFSFPINKSFIETKPYGKGKVARYYLFVIESSDEVTILPNPITGIIEHHEYRWLPYSAARALLVPRVREVIDWAHLRLPPR